MTDKFANFEYRVVHRVRYGRYVSAASILGAIILAVIAFASGKIQWNVVGRFIFSQSIIEGVSNTIWLTLCSMVVGISLGLISALMRSSNNPVMRSVAHGYIFVFRSIPVLLQLLIWYNLALIFPIISVFGYFETPTTQIITPFIAALLAFGIQQGAYTSEVIRSGLLSVDRGQTEAALSIGMTKTKALFRIVVPQAMRVIVPPIGNETIGMVKFTSLASVIQYRDVIYSAQTIYYTNTRVIELLFVSAFWYAIVIAILSIIQSRIEIYFGKYSAANKNEAST